MVAPGKSTPSMIKSGSRLGNLIELDMIYLKSGYLIKKKKN